MPLVFAIFFVSLFSVYTTLNLPAQAAASVASVADMRATNAFAYKAVLVAYLNANPSFSGPIPDASISLPLGLVRDPRWINVVSGRTLFVFESTPSNTAGLLDALYWKSKQSLMVGKSNGSTLINSKGYSTGVVIPVTTPAIPNGAIVLVGK